jgi:hypothetical protein
MATPEVTSTAEMHSMAGAIPIVQADSTAAAVSMEVLTGKFHQQLEVLAAGGIYRRPLHFRKKKAKKDCAPSPQPLRRNPRYNMCFLEQ